MDLKNMHVYKQRKPKHVVALFYGAVYLETNVFHGAKICCEPLIGNLLVADTTEYFEEGDMKRSLPWYRVFVLGSKHSVMVTAAFIGEVVGHAKDVV